MHMRSSIFHFDSINHIINTKDMIMTYHSLTQPWQIYIQILKNIYMLIDILIYHISLIYLIYFISGIQLHQQLFSIWLPLPGRWLYLVFAIIATGHRSSTIGWWQVDYQWNSKWNISFGSSVYKSQTDICLKQKVENLNAIRGFYCLFK